MTTSHPGHRGRVDGNAAGGYLIDLFGRDMTAARGTCAQCHRAADLADAIAEVDESGMTLLCRGCSHTLLAFVRSGGRSTLVLGSLAQLSWEGDRRSD